MTDYLAYQEYVSLKLHFSDEKYDYFRYNGKIKSVNPDTFSKLNHKYYFTKLAKKKDVKGFLIANLLKKTDTWIGELVNDLIYQDIYLNWLQKQQSLTYVFEKDLDKLDSNLNKNFEIVNGEYPIILKLLFRNIICLETFAILCDICSTYKYLEKNISDYIIWPETYLKAKKYLPFIEFDKKKFSQIVLDKFSN